jgi:hypothetical protein
MTDSAVPPHPDAIAVSTRLVLGRLIQDRHDVLKLNIFNVIRNDRVLPAMIRKMIGFTTTSKSLGNPYSVP